MKPTFCVLFTAVLVVGPLPAIAATFTAVAQGNTVAIVSQSDKAQRCNLSVPFSFMHEGVRHKTVTYCEDRDVVISEQAVVCSVTHEEIIEPKIEGPVEAKCE